MRILVLLRTFRLEIYLVFSIFQLEEMWVSVAQRWSPGQDSPSEDRPYALSFLSDAASMSKYFVTNVPRHDSEESINLCTLNYYKMKHISSSSLGLVPCRPAKPAHNLMIKRVFY